MNLLLVLWVYEKPVRSLELVRITQSILLYSDATKDASYLTATLLKEVPVELGPTMLLFYWIAIAKVVINFYQPTTHFTWLAGPETNLHFPHLYLSVSALIMCATITSHVHYTVAMPQLTWQFRRLLCVVTMSSLAQL